MPVRSSKRAHSPSSIALAKRCRRAWWLCYGEKIREPEVTWEQIASGEVEPKGGQRSKAIGTQVHAWAELYLSRASTEADLARIEWDSPPGRALQALVPLLPPKRSVAPEAIERAIAVVVDGVLFRGYADLSPRGEVWDHKTTRDIRAYALLPDAVAQAYGVPERSLKNDLQACVYALWSARRSGAEHTTLRWNYTETGKAVRALPVVQSITAEHATYVVRSAVRIAKEVETYRTREDAKPNPLACDDYGGCWYRREGHCTVPRPLGALIAKQANEKERAGITKMAGKSFKDVLEANKKAAAKGAAPAASKPKAGPGRPPKAAKKPEPVEEEEETEEAEEAEAETEETDEGGEAGESSLAEAVAALANLLPAGTTLSVPSSQAE